MTINPATIIDTSSQSGFQFSYTCPNCRQPLQAPFIESKSYKKGQMIRGIGSFIGTAVSMVGNLTGRYNIGSIGYDVQRGVDAMTNQFQNMSPEWKKEHGEALEIAKKFFSEHCDQCEKNKPQQQQAQSGQGRFCTNCGEPNSTDAKFCAKCGNKIG